MEKINVRVPARLLGEIDEAWEKRGYSSRSEAIRDALRDWVSPAAELSDEVLTALEVSSRQRDRGEVASTDEVRDRLGLDSEE